MSREAVEYSIDLSKSDKTSTWVALARRFPAHIRTWAEDLALVKWPRKKTPESLTDEGIVVYNAE